MYSQKNGTEIATSVLEEDMENLTLLFLPSEMDASVKVAYL